MEGRPVKRRKVQFKHRKMSSAAAPPVVPDVETVVQTVVASKVGKKRKRRGGGTIIRPMSDFTRDYPDQVIGGNLEVAARRVRMENRQAYNQIAACMRESNIEIVFDDGDSDDESAERSREDDILWIQQMTVDQVDAVFSSHVAEYSLRNMLQYKNATQKYKEPVEIPFITAAYHTKYLRQKRQGEDDCIRGKLCEGMFIGEASSAKGIILRAFWTPKEEKIVEKAQSLNKRHNMRKRCCLLCDRRHTHELCVRADIRSPTFHYKYASEEHEESGNKNKAQSNDDNDTLFYTAGGHPAVKNTHQVYFGIRGEYRTDCIIGTQDRGSECTTGLHGAALTYARTDYSFAKDEDGRTIVSQDALLF